MSGWIPSPSDADAIHDNVPGEIAALTEKGSPVDADLVLIEDSEDGNSKKKVQVGNLPGGGGGGEQVLPFHRSGDLEVTPGTLPFPAPFNMTILGVRAAVGTPPTGDDAIVDVNKNGTTIFTTQGNRPTISDGNATSTEATPDVTSVDEGDLLTVDIDQVGSSTAGADLVVVIRFEL